jgi:hypothetical protein
MRKIREFSLFCLGIVLIVCGISIDAVDAATIMCPVRIPMLLILTLEHKHYRLKRSVKLTR